MNTELNESELTRYGYAKDGKIYLKSTLGQPDRQIGEVKLSENEALAYFSRRFAMLESKVEAMLDALIKAENKGSYLMQILHLKESLISFNALGPFEDLHAKLEEAEQQIRQLIENNRVKNYEIKKKLLDSAREALAVEDLRESIRAFKEVRFNWMTVGALAKDVGENLEADFEALNQKFLEVKEKYTAEREIEIGIRTQKLQILLETAAKLNTYPPEVEQSFFKMRKLEDEWKAVGNVPKTIYAPLFLEFKRIKKTIAKYARKGPPQRRSGLSAIFIPRNIPPHEEELYKNLRYRMDLIAEAEGLLKMDLRQANEMAKDIQARWKVAGHIPPKYKSEIFNMFNAISDRIFESSYLARVVHTKYPHFRTMPAAEQLEAKIEAMDEIILKEDMNVRVTQAEFQFMTEDERNLEENRARFSRLNTSVRKLKMKTTLMHEMKRELERMKSGTGFDPSRSSGGYGSRPNYGDRRESGGYGSGREHGGGYSERRDSGSGYGDRRSYNPQRPAYSSDRPYRSDRPTTENRDYYKKPEQGNDEKRNNDSGFYRSDYNKPRY